jgi:hypothetical protein
VQTALGGVSTFFGYFLLGPVLFSTAFMIGGGACFVAVRAGLDAGRASAWMSVVAMLVGGGLSGFAAVKMLAVGMFAVGATLGVAASAALKAVLWSRVFPASPHAGFVLGSCVLGLTFGVVALTLRKQMLILSTAYAGAFAMFFGIGHFAGHFPTLQKLDQVERGMFDPWAVLYLALTAVFGTAGMFAQLHLTRDKPMPSRAPYARHRGHRRVRATSRGSDWSAGEDAEWERELLAASTRIDGQTAGSTSRPHLKLSESSPKVRDVEAAESVESGGGEPTPGLWPDAPWTARSSPAATSDADADSETGSASQGNAPGIGPLDRRRAGHGGAGSEAAPAPAGQQTAPAGAGTVSV